MIGSTLILMAVLGQPPAPTPAPYPPAVAARPGEPEGPREWLLATAPDGKPVHILGWRQADKVRFRAQDYPQLVGSTPAPDPRPTGVISGKFPTIQAGHSWTGGNAPHVVGEAPARAARPEVYLTIIGDRSQCRAVEQGLTGDPNFQALAREMGDRLAVNAYRPTNPLVADVGLVAGGNPDVVVQDATGKEVARWKDHAAPSRVIEAVRKADPNYHPGGGGPARGADLPEWTWGAVGVVGLYLIFKALASKRA